MYIDGGGGGGVVRRAINRKNQSIFKYKKSNLKLWLNL